LVLTDSIRYQLYADRESALDEALSLARKAVEAKSWRRS
jgi:hypothetical protein